MLFVGDVSLDLSMSVPSIPAPDEKVHCSGSVETPGGVVTNAAVAYVRAGGAGSLLVRLGSDRACRHVFDLLRAEGLILAEPSGEGALCRVVTLLEPHGEKRLLLDPAQSLYPSLEEVEACELAGRRHVHTACYDPAAWRLIDRARLEGLSWSIDLEPASFVSGIDALSDVVDGARLLFVNDRAAAAIGADAVDRLFAMGAQAVLRTRGPEGASLHCPEGVYEARPPAALPIVDTTGAGDCLAGWFLAGLEAGLEPQANLERAVRAATMSCRSIGAQSGYPTLAEMKNCDQ